MTDDEKAIATRVAEGAFPIFLAREVNAGDGFAVADKNAWVVAEMFMKERRKYIEAQIEAKKAQDSTLTDYERGLLDVGNKIMAIKEVRERTGQSLMDAKALVDAYSPPQVDVPF